jgi:hypothetical protein
MSDPLWQPNEEEQSVTYPITEILRRGVLKIRISDRAIPMTSDAWGMFPELVMRYRKFLDWKHRGVKFVKVYYDPGYFYRNRHTIRIMDPLHTYFVRKYVSIK